MWFVFPVSLEVTAPVLKSAPSSSCRVPSHCWVYILHFQSNTPAAFSQCAEAVSVTAAWSSFGVQVTGAAQTPKPAGIQ